MSALMRIAFLGWVIGLAIGLVGQGVPTLHVPGHELTLVFVVIAAFAQLHLSALAWNWLPYGPDRLEIALGAGLISVVTLAASTHCIAAAATWSRGCSLTNTGLFLWVTWVPLGWMAAVVGLALARGGWGWGVRTLVFAGVAALSWGHDMLQFTMGVPIVDLLIGMPLGLNQRADMGLPTLHLLQRGWLAGAALMAWTLLSWRHHGTRGAGWLAAWATAAVVAVTVGWGSRIGVGFDGRARSAELDTVQRTPHFRLHYDASGRARFRIDVVQREAEWQLHQLSTAWGIPVEGLVVDVYLYDDRDDLAAFTGRGAHAGRRWLAIDLDDVFGTTLAHELVHAVDQQVGTPWHRVQLSRGITEGSAMAWTEGSWERDAAHRLLAAALANDDLPSAGTLLSPFGFSQTRESLAYSASGSFVGWLIREHGVEKWRELMVSWDVEATYGATVDQLDAGWRAYLESVPVDVATALRARFRFDRTRYPSRLSQRCPKLGLTVPDAEADARGAAGVGDAAQALEIYGELAAAEDDERWVWGIIAALNQLERHAEALEVLRALSPTTAVDEQVRRLDAMLGPLATLGDTDALLEALDRRLLLDSEPQLVALRALLEVEALAPDVQDLFWKGQDWARQTEVLASLTRLGEAHPEHTGELNALGRVWMQSPALSYMRGTPAELERLDQRLDQVRLQPEICDETPGLVQSGLLLIQLGDCRRAAAVAEVVAAACTDPDTRWRASRLQDRLEWEATPDLFVTKACLHTR